MSRRRAFAAAVCAVSVSVATSCSSVQKTTIVNDVTVATAAPYVSGNVAVQFGVGTSHQTADIFDVANHTLLGRIALSIPSAHTQIGPAAFSPDARHLYVTAYDESDPRNTLASVYDLNLTTQTCRQIRFLGRGRPVDLKVIFGQTLAVLVADTTATRVRRASRVDTIDVVSGKFASYDNPLPADDAGTIPTPISMLVDTPHRFVIFGDERGALYAVRMRPFSFFRKIGGASANFTANGDSVVFDQERAVMYQFGVLTTVDDNQRTQVLGAILSTSVANGTTHLKTIPYTPIPGGAIDRAGQVLYFISLYERVSGVPFVTRYDIISGSVTARPIVSEYGDPELPDVTDPLALSADGAHLLVPVRTGDAPTPTGAMLEFDPASLVLQSSAASPDDFESGGVVTN